jgi:hypothetical protein
MNGFASTPHWKRSQLRAPRTAVSLPASMVTMSAYRFPELVDISASGAKLVGSPLPPKGTTAILRAGALQVMCRVVWVKGEACGIRFEEPVAPYILKQVQLEGAVELQPCAPATAVSEGKPAED